MCSTANLRISSYLSKTFHQKASIDRKPLTHLVNFQLHYYVHGENHQSSSMDFWFWRSSLWKSEPVLTLAMVAITAL